MVDKPMVDRNEEAARWFAAARRGVMLHEERAKYDEWRRDPENADRLAVLEAIWLDLAPRPAAVEPFQPLQRHAAVSHRRQLAAVARTADEAHMTFAPAQVNAGAMRGGVAAGAGHALSSISTNTNSKLFGLMTSCSTPVRRA